MWPFSEARTAQQQRRAVGLSISFTSSCTHTHTLVRTEWVGECWAHSRGCCCCFSLTTLYSMSLCSCFPSSSSSFCLANTHTRSYILPPHTCALRAREEPHSLQGLPTTTAKAVAGVASTSSLRLLCFFALLSLSSLSPLSLLSLSSLCVSGAHASASSSEIDRGRGGPTRRRRRRCCCCLRLHRRCCCSFPPLLLLSLFCVERPVILDR